jgi:hypothetical protein
LQVVHESGQFGSHAPVAGLHVVQGSVHGQSVQQELLSSGAMQQPSPQVSQSWAQFEQFSHPASQIAFPQSDSQALVAGLQLAQGSVHAQSSQQLVSSSPRLQHPSPQTATGSQNPLGPQASHGSQSSSRQIKTVPTGTASHLHLAVVLGSVSLWSMQLGLPPPFDLPLSQLVHVPRSRKPLLSSS